MDERTRRINMKKQLIIVGIIFLLVCVELSGCIGGPCLYESYQGRATILSITVVNNSGIEDEKWREGYRVIFIFQLNENQTKEQKRLVLYKRFQNNIETERVFTLTNGWYPNKDYLEKYEIEEEAVFDCELKLITHGTCSPVIFDFKNINESDYLKIY